MKDSGIIDERDVTDHEHRVRFLLNRLVGHHDTFTARADSGRIEELAWLLLHEVQEGNK